MTTTTTPAAWTEPPVGVAGGVADAAAPVGVRSVITGKRVIMSATARGKVRNCPRQWWYQKVAGEPRDESPNMALGTDVHAVAERWLRIGDAAIVGDDTRPARIFAAGRHLLPKPGTVHIEEPVGGMCGPLEFMGKVDFRPATLSNYHPHADAWIGDHKTTGNMAFALGPTGLANDPQVHAYAWKVFGPDGVNAGFADGDRVGFVHVYYATKGAPTGLRTFAVTEWGRVVDTWLNEYLPAAVYMAELAAVTDADDVPANPGACHDYGRLCPHAAICSASPQNGSSKWSVIFG